MKYLYELGPLYDNQAQHEYQTEERALINDLVQAVKELQDMLRLPEEQMSELAPSVRKRDLERLVESGAEVAGILRKEDSGEPRYTVEELREKRYGYRETDVLGFLKWLERNP